MKPIKRKKGESLDQLLRRFKRESHLITSEYRSRETYIKPSEKRNRNNNKKKHIKKQEARAAAEVLKQRNQLKRRGFVSTKVNTGRSRRNHGR